MVSALAFYSDKPSLNFLNKRPKNKEEAGVDPSLKKRFVKAYYVRLKQKISLSPVEPARAD